MGNTNNKQTNKATNSIHVKLFGQVGGNPVVSALSRPKDLFCILPSFNTVGGGRGGGTYNVLVKKVLTKVKSSKKRISQLKKVKFWFC